MKSVTSIYYTLVLVVLTLILYDVISVTSKSIVAMIVCLSVVVVGIIEVNWSSIVARIRYKKWYNALPDHIKNDVDLYRTTSSKYDGPDLFRYDTYGPDPSKDSDNKKNTVV